ncbi:hypothetical protein GB937_005923 [Aspergillus fischeri]|nr:hypothetical protein GB937_005923 [Aspergillus fischeri]
MSSIILQHTISCVLSGDLLLIPKGDSAPTSPPAHIFASAKKPAHTYFGTGRKKRQRERLPTQSSLLFLHFI